MLRSSFTIILLNSISLYVLASIRVLDKGVLPLQKDSVALIFYLDIDNEDRSNPCKIHPLTHRCCLTESEDCGKMEVYADNIEEVKPKDRITLLNIYPTVFQHDHFGYCNFVIDYQCGKRKKRKRENVHVPFDTRCKKKSHHLLKNYLGDRKVKICESIDEDSLSNCEAVNCDLKYSGSKPFYDGEVKKCIEAAECQSDPSKELPDLVYVPTSNTCRDLENPLTIADIYAINTGIGVVKETTKAEGVEVVIKSNFSTISQNLKFLRDVMYGKLCPVLRAESSNLGECSRSAFISILLYIVGISATLLLLACCVNTIVWFHGKWSTGDLEKQCDDIQRRFRRSNVKEIAKKQSKVNNNVTNSLLKEVIVSNLPLELRESVVGICERVENEVRMNGRYGTGDGGSQDNVNDDYTSNSSSSSVYDDNTQLLK